MEKNWKHQNNSTKKSTQVDEIPVLHADFSTWYNGEFLQGLEPEGPKGILKDSSEVEKHKQRAKLLYEKILDNYVDSKRGRDDHWMKTVQKAGTLSDKLAAYVVQIQDHPIEKLYLMDEIFEIANAKKRRNLLLALNSLKSLFLLNLLPDRPLKVFEESIQHISKQKITDKVLIYFFLEDKIKRYYDETYKLLEYGCKDNVIHQKESAVKFVFELLSEKPEKERSLLTLLINKMGDPENRVCSKANHLLSLLLQKHPNMKLHVIKETERFLFRSHNSERAQYYGTNFLNQVYLSKSEPDSATKLIEIYITLFQKYIQQELPEDHDEDLIKEQKNVAKHKEETGKDKEKRQKKKKMSAKEEEREEKKVINSRMLDMILTGVNRAFPYAPFNPDFYEKHLDSIFKIVHTGNLQKKVHALNLLFQILTNMNNFHERYYRALYEVLLSPELKSSTKLTNFFNLLFRSFKFDMKIERVHAFVKRVCQISLYQEPNFICAALYLLSETIKLKPGIKSIINQTESFQHEVDDDDNAQEYDPLKREPLFARAQTSCAWELNEMTFHYHPSVVKFAEQILNGESIKYDGEPLVDFSLSEFLDRFSFKNPKQEHESKETGMKSVYVKRSNREEPVNTLNFLQRKLENVPEQEVFFYKYFKERDSVFGKKQAKKTEEVSPFGGENDLDEHEDKPDDAEIFDEEDDLLLSDDEGAMEALLGSELEDMADTDDGPHLGSSGALAAADDYAHLLDTIGEETPGDMKRKKWESRTDNPNFGKRKQNTNGGKGKKAKK